jgi:hypothetical protein
MENKQTALEWLESQQEIQNMINVYSCDAQLFLRMIFNQAIQMEKDQIIYAHQAGWSDAYDYYVDDYSEPAQAKDYYNETYGK